MYLRKVVSGQVVLGLVALFPLVNGCSKPIEPQVPPLGQARIQKLASIFREFAVTQKRQPANVEELKAWAKKLDKGKLGWLGIDNVDDAFVSPRDQQPYVLVRRGSTFGPMIILAHEKTGEGGKRYLVTSTGSMLELDEAGFKEVMARQ